MAQRVTQQREIYVRNEVTEGVDPALPVAQGGENVAWAGGDAILVSNLTVGPDKQYLQRSFTGAFGSRSGRMGIQADPTLSFTVELRGGNTVKAPEIDLLLKSVLGNASPADDTGSTTIASAVDGANFTLAVGAGFNPGRAIAVETSTAGKYEVGWITSNTAGVIVLNHALSFTPTAGKQVRGSLNYALGDTTNQSLSFRIWLDSSSYIMFNGCKGSMKIDAASPGSVGTATFTFKCMSWKHDTLAKPAASYDATVASTATKFKINASFPDLKVASVDLGVQVAKKMTQNAANGCAGHVIANRDLKGSLQLYDVGNTQFDDWTAGTEAVLAQQFGDVEFNMIAYQIPKAQRSKVAYGDDGGLTTDAVDFQALIASGNDEIKIAYL